MSAKELLDEAMKLKPEERVALIEGLIKSLDEPDKKLDEIWAEEAEKRLQAYRGGKRKASRWRKYLWTNDARHLTSDAKL
jgi:putative addiction module component (TIGR02574 family)